MRVTEIGPFPLTLIASLVVAVVLLAIRVFVMQRVQSRRQRENRQETERLKSLVSAYRSLAGSFSPALAEHGTQMEEALSDVVLFGSLPQVEMAAACLGQLKRREPVDYQRLIEALRGDLRTQLGLDPIPASLALPAAGPGRSAQRNGRGEGESGARGGAGGGGGGGAGGAGGGLAVGAGGLGVGLLAGEAGNPRE